jgi:hypothetical protein
MAGDALYYLLVINTKLLINGSVRCNGQLLFPLKKNVYLLFVTAPLILKFMSQIRSGRKQSVFKLAAVIVSV